MLADIERQLEQHATGRYRRIIAIRLLGRRILVFDGREKREEANEHRRKFMTME